MKKGLQSQSRIQKYLCFTMLNTRDEKESCSPDSLERDIPENESIFHSRVQNIIFRQKFPKSRPREQVMYKRRHSLCV